MTGRPKITNTQWYFLMYYCGGNLKAPVAFLSHDSLEGFVATECRSLGLIKRQPECIHLYSLTESGRAAIYLDVLDSVINNPAAKFLGIDHWPYPDRADRKIIKIQKSIVSCFLKLIRWFRA